MSDVKDEKSVVVVSLCIPSPTIPSARIKADVKQLEESEDCFFLEFDPFELVVLSDCEVDDDDVCIVAEKGKIASRDYPHARYLCPRHPFGKSAHVLYCKMVNNIYNLTMHFLLICIVSKCFVYWLGMCSVIAMFAIRLHRVRSGMTIAMRQINVYLTGIL